MYASQGHLESRTKVEKEQDIHQREVSLYKSWVKLCCKRKEVSEFFFHQERRIKKETHVRMFCRTESSGGGQKHIKYISLPLLCIVVNSTEKPSVLRKYIALKMKGKCLVTRSGGGIRCKTYVILPHKTKAQRSAKKRHSLILR